MVEPGYSLRWPCSEISNLYSALQREAGNGIYLWPTIFTLRKVTTRSRFSVVSWDSYLSFYRGSVWAMDRGPPPSALPLAYSSITSNQRDWSQDLEQDAVWVISVLLGMAWRYIGSKNQPRSSDIPKCLSYFGPQNKSSLCPNCQPLQQGYMEWILRVGWVWFPDFPAASTPLALLPSLASPESFSECSHCPTALEIRQG